MSDTTWIGSLNIQQFVNQQMTRESLNIDKIMQPKLELLSQKQSMLKAQQSIYTQLQSSVSNFYQNLTQLGSTFNPTFQIGTSNSSVVNAQVVGSATAGTHSLTVQQLAQAASVASNTVFSSSTDAQQMGETLNFSMGAVDSPSSTFAVTVNVGDSLQTIANNINSAASANNSGVSASIVSTSNGQYQLIVSSMNTGTDNQVNISEVVTSGQGLNISTQAGANAGTLLKTAQNALFTFDGLQFNQASNNNIIIEGMNLSLLGVGTSNLTVSESTPVTAVATAIGNTINIYNSLVTSIETSIAQGDGDPRLKLMLSSLQSAINGTFSGGGAYQNLMDIGITLSKSPTTIEVPKANGDGTIPAYITGLLQVDNDVLTSALNSDYSDVQSLLLNTTSGIFQNIATNLLAPGTGSVWSLINDPDDGGVSETNKRLAAVTTELADAQGKVKELKSGLVEKYARLEVALTAMQNTSQLITQETQLLMKS